MRVVSARVCALTFAALLLQSCAVSVPDLPFLGLTADQLFKQAADNYAAAKVVRVDETFSKDRTRFSGNIEASKVGSATALVIFKGARVELVTVGGKSWVKTDKAYWDNLGRTDPLAQKVLPNHWVVINATLLADNLIQIAAPDKVDKVLSGKHPDLTKGPAQTVNGQSTVRLSHRDGDIYVTKSSPAHLVRIVYAPGFIDSTGVSALDADVSYPATLDVPTPASFYDPNQPKTLPALFRVEDPNNDVKRGACNASGCAYTVTVHNLDGRSATPATLAVKLTKQDNSEIGACTASISPIDYDQKETVSCTVSGPAWATFYGAAKQWFREVTVHNPVWDD